MKNRNWTVTGVGAVALIGGVCLAVIYQGAAVAAGAELYHFGGAGGLVAGAGRGADRLGAA